MLHDKSWYPCVPSLVAEPFDQCVFLSVYAAVIYKFSRGSSAIVIMSTLCNERFCIIIQKEYAVSHLLGDDDRRPRHSSRCDGPQMICGWRSVAVQSLIINCFFHCNCGPDTEIDRSETTKLGWHHPATPSSVDKSGAVESAMRLQICWIVFEGDKGVSIEQRLRLFRSARSDRFLA